MFRHMKIYIKYIRFFRNTEPCTNFCWNLVSLEEEPKRQTKNYLLSIQPYFVERKVATFHSTKLLRIAALGRVSDVCKYREESYIFSIPFTLQKWDWMRNWQHFFRWILLHSTNSQQKLVQGSVIKSKISK